jgi:uncharacterized SAM-binding protein YcdF (DUF218 family)
MTRARWYRLSRVKVIVFGLFVALFLTFTVVLFIYPSTNAPRRSNAIVVLGGPGPRVEKGIALARAGYAPYLAISVSNRPTQCPPAPHGVTVICFIPHPLTTQGEARAVATLAQEHHWSRIIVVASVPQTTRARIRLDRCYRGTMLFDPASPGAFGEWVRSVFYEWGALIKALTLQRGC